MKKTPLSFTVCALAFAGLLGACKSEVLITSDNSLPALGIAAPTSTVNSEYSSSLNTDGYRIAARNKYTVTADGFYSVEQVGWYDHQLGNNCSPRIAEDSQYRFLPDNALMLTTQQSNELLYSDVNCSRRIVAGSYQVCGPEFMYVLAPFGAPILCQGQPYRVYSIGAYFEASTIYEKTPGRCIEKSVPASGYYFLEAPVPPTAFADMTMSTVP